MRVVRARQFINDFESSQRRVVHEIDASSAQRLEIAVVRVIDDLMANPQIGRPHVCSRGAFRALSLRPFRHLLLVYQADEEQIMLLRILDVHRAPGTYGDFEEA